MITIFRGDLLRKVSIKQTHLYPGTFIRNESAIFYTIVDALHMREDEAFEKSYENNVIVIEGGTTVEIQAVKCSGVSECWKGVDESDCGFSTFETMIFGNTCFFP